MRTKELQVQTNLYKMNKNLYNANNKRTTATKMFVSTHVLADVSERTGRRIL